MAALVLKSSLLGAVVKSLEKLPKFDGLNKVDKKWTSALDKVDELIDIPSTVTRWSPVRLPWTDSVLRFRLFVPP